MKPREKTLALLIALLITLPCARAADITVALPQIPDRIFNITDHGAVADGTTDNTKAIEKAMAAARDAGGGVVLVPAGKFLTGPFDLASKINLKIDEGATLLFSDSPDAYPIDTEDNRHRMCITAKDCTDIAITGKGTIDGQGATWWEAFMKIKGTPQQKTATRRPNLIDFTDCQRVLFKDVMLRNPPMFTVVPRDCDDVTFDGVRFYAPDESPNTDGIDPSGRNYLITRCDFDTGDDCIAFKPQRPRDDGGPSCENILITDCTFRHGHGLSIGGQTPYGLRNMVVRNCTFENPDAAIRMKAPRGEGGLVENLTYENITMRKVKLPIFITSYYPNSTTPKEPDKDPPQPVTATTPIWRNIRISNVRAEDCPEAGRIFGLPEMPVSDITFTNVYISAEKPLQIFNARQIVFKNSRLEIEKGPPLTLGNAQVIGLDAQAAGN